MSPRTVCAWIAWIAWITVALAGAGGCARTPAERASSDDPSANDPGVIPSVPVGDIPGHEKLPIDDKPKEGPRMLPAEAYMRTYLQLFGGLSPAEVQSKARGADGRLFDTWGDYLAAIGMPSYKDEVARNTQTNALMVAAFERLGIALCDRAVERDLRGKLPVAKRPVFAFDATSRPPTEAEFAERFNVLHRRFIGYPVSLAPTERVGKFRQLYDGTVARHAAPGAPRSTLTPTEAGWAAVCQALVRHPEFHVY